MQRKTCLTEKKLNENIFKKIFFYLPGYITVLRVTTVHTLLFLISSREVTHSCFHSKALRQPSIMPIQLPYQVNNNNNNYCNDSNYNTCCIMILK